MRRAIVLALLLLPPPARAEGRGPLSESFRGMTLDFDADRVFYVQAGDLADVIAVGDWGAGGEKIAVTLLKMKSIVSIKPSQARAGKTTVELALNPNEAQYLALAADSGGVWLSLRKQGDQEDAPMESASWSKLIGPELTPVFRREAPAIEEAPKPAASSTRSTAAPRGRIVEGKPALSLSLASDKVAFLEPGDRVDIVATLERKKGTERTSNAGATVIQNAAVLDVRKSEARPGRSILLLGLNWLEIEYAALAAETAEIHVLRRNKGDAKTHPMESTSLEKLFR